MAALLSPLLLAQVAPFPGAVRSSGCGHAWTRSYPGFSTKLPISVFEPSVGTNLTRGFVIHVPSTYKASVAVPIVYDFHGFYDFASREETENHLTDVIAEEMNAIVVYANGSWDDPLGIKEHPHFHPNSWNAMGTTGETRERPGYFTETCDHRRSKWGQYRCYTSCKARPAGCDPTYDCYSSSCHDDVSYAEALMDTLESQLCIDTQRVHVTGISAGGLMVYQLAVSLSRRLASVVPVAGGSLNGFNVPPAYPLALMDIHGSSDTYVPANQTYQYGAGPNGSIVSNDGMYYTPLAQTTAAWSKVLGCDDAGVRAYPTSFDGTRAWSCVQPHGSCASTGTSLVTCSWQGGHNWPWINEYPTGYARVAWEFFAKHPKAGKEVEDEEEM